MEMNENTDMIEIQLEEQPEEHIEETEDHAEDLTEQHINGTEEEGAEEPDDGGAEDPDQVQSAQERHRQAAARRARENAARQAAEQARIDAIYANAYEGQTNPYTGKPIRTESDFKAYQQARDAEEHQMKLNRLKESGVDGELLTQMIQEAVNSNPAVQEATAATQQARTMMQKAQEREQMAMISNEMKIIGSIDPTVQGAVKGKNLDEALDTLRDLYPDTWEKTLEYHAKGIALSDAFQLANRKALMKNSFSAGKQAAINAAAGVSHLKSMKNNNKTAVSMPREVLEQFRKINPGHTDAEYARFWAAQHKE